MSSVTHKSKNSDTPVKRIQLPQPDESSFKVKCGAKTALFFPLRLKKTGKLEKECQSIKHWLSPSEFES